MVVLAHILLGLLYSIVTPPWEAHDEWAHYRYAEFVAQEHRLPPPDQRLTTTYRYDEASQPPLYYLVTAVPLLFVPPDTRPPVPNPFAEDAEGVNFAVHDPAVEAFPWRGRILGLHLARWLSLLLSTLGLWPTLALARWLFPTRREVALGALAIQALSPQAIFMGSTVTNDGLVAALSGLALYHGLRVALGPWQLRHAIWLAVATSLALLTKYTALPLIPFAVLCLLIALLRAVRRSDTRVRALAGSLAALGGMVGLSGWWFARSQATTGYWATRDQETLWWLRQDFWQTPARFMTEPAWRLLPAALNYGFQTYWASFGWGNVGAPRWVYTLLAVLTLGGLAGAVWYRLHPRQKSAIDAPRGAFTLLAVFILLIVALPLYRELLNARFLLRGRYILPTLPAVSVLLGAGWLAWPRVRAARRVWIILSAGLVVLAVYLALGVIRPAYARPAAVDMSRLPTYAQPLAARFMRAAGGPLAEIVAYDTWPASPRPGEGLLVTLWWRALGQTQRNLTLGVQLLDATGTVITERYRFPGAGNFATSLWRPGDTFQETVWLTLPLSMTIPMRGTINVSLFDIGGSLLVQDGQGAPIGDAVQFGRIPLRAPPVTNQIAAAPPLAEFGGQVTLSAVRVESETGVYPRAADVVLTWQALQPVARPYVAFIHLLDDQGRQVWGDDKVPGGDDYPLDLWASGEIITETRRLNLPDDLPGGAYTLALGLYDPADGARLPAAAQGGSAPDNRVPVATFDLPAWHRQFIPEIWR